jgi:N-acetylneuraminic acid mutarotase
MPLSMTEMSCGWLGDNLYVTGMSNAWEPAISSPMFVFNIVSNTWSYMNPDRPYPGNHHAVEVFGDRMYLIGGFDGNSSGQVQIYDPSTNGWSIGAPAPYPAGSCCSAFINGKIYIAGGLVGVISGTTNLGVSTNAAAVYDPVANTWSSLPPLPFTTTNGMNHAASATDGSKFYIFGGRDDHHAPAIGYDAVQIYDPVSNTWATSVDSGSTLAPLPQERGGMGKAVYYNGDFYVMGGETVDGGTGATPNNVYNRVDIYNVASNTWRLGTPMPTARHGIFPVLRGNRIYVVGGGGASPFPTPPVYTSVFEIYIAP